jgi:glycosyltransferase involved in cell wall biosynthesis
MSWSPHLRRVLYNLAEKIVVVSRETGESVQAKTGLKSSKMVIIYNGIAVERYSNPDRLQSRRSLGLSDSTVVFGSVSRLDPIKDHVTMLRAFEKVTRKHDDSMLLIVGEGPARKDIEQAVKEMHLSGKVILTGFSDKVYSLLAGMDLFLQTSMEEGLSLSILEAAASGIPIVATDVGGTPEIIRSGRDGILLGSGNVDAFADAMNRFIEDPEPFRLMADEAKKVIKRQFSLESMVHRYESLYRDILRNKGGAAWAES